MIELEVEDEAWRAVAEVEAVATRAAEAALLSREAGEVARRGSAVTEGASPPPPSQDHLQPSLAPSTMLRMVPLPRFAGEESSMALDVTLLLAGDAEVRELNARFRGRDTATNVLSFPAPESAAPHLGDIALAYGVCAREAAEQGKALGDHLSHLVVHGVLHLLGYDHQADAEAEVMEDMERQILSRLGVADPYRTEPADVRP